MSNPCRYPFIAEIKTITTVAATGLFDFSASFERNAMAAIARSVYTVAGEDSDQIKCGPLGDLRIANLAYLLN